MEIPSIFFGLFLGLFMSTLTKVVQQTRNIWKRTRSLSIIYLYMIWIEAIVNLIFSLTTYLYLCGVIQSSLAYYFGAVSLWVIQTQLLSQIIANRVALIMVNKRKSRLLKWSLFVLISCINVSVYCIWIPAHMPSTTPTKILLNNIWERAEKSLFLLIDFGLNCYFLYLVRSRLIGNGLTKYWRLFNFNAAIVVISLTMDILLLGLLSLPDPYVYVQFAPVAYIVKLQIELVMADLISKVVRSGNAERERGDDWYINSNHHGTRSNRRTGTGAGGGPAMPQTDGFVTHSVGMNTKVSGGMADGVRNKDKTAGIVKTVTTVVNSDSGNDSGEESLVNRNRLTGDFMSHNSCHANGSASP